MRPPRWSASLLVAGLLVAAAPLTPARAESAADAQRAAHEAAATVASLQPRAQRALAAYQQALADLAGAVSRSVDAAQQADIAAQRADAERARADNRVRALYMSGGTVGLAASVLDATTAADALRRVSYVQRLVETTTASAGEVRRHAGTAADDAARLARAADRRVTTVADVTRRYEELSAALDAAGATLARLSARARRLSEAARAADLLRALAAQAAASAAERVATAKAMPVPTDFKRLYVGASRTCPGLSWSVLAAIGQVESGHGRNNGPSPAGARGPMQFLPATFAAYAVDGDHDGDTDIDDPADSIYTAAHYLCANGAGHGGDSLYRAIWHYNHADWYVQLVLRIAGQLAGRPVGSDPVGGSGDGSGLG